MKKIVLIISVLIFAMRLSSEGINNDSLIKKIKECWETVNDYTLTLETYSKKGDKEEKSIIKQKFLKPNWIYMKIIDGKGKGSVGVFNPITNKVKGHKGGLLKIITLTLDPSDKKTSSIRGHRIDQSGFGTLIKRLIEYNEMKEITSVTETSFETKLAYLFTAEVKDTLKLWGAKKEKIWVEEETLFPLRLEQYTEDGKLVHYSKYWDVCVNVGLKEEDFKP